MPRCSANRHSWTPALAAFSATGDVMVVRIRRMRRAGSFILRGASESAEDDAYKSCETAVHGLVVRSLKARQEHSTEGPCVRATCSKEVGKPGGSPFVFVTEDGVVRAAFTATRGDRDTVMGIAIEFASRLPRNHEVFVEDQTGTAWENDEARRRSAVDDD